MELRIATVKVDVEMVLQCRLKGLKWSVIAKFMGFSVSVVKYHCNKYLDVEAERTGNRRSIISFGPVNPLTAKIIAFRNEGKKYSEVAKIMGISIGSINYHVNKYRGNLTQYTKPTGSSRVDRGKTCTRCKTQPVGKGKRFLCATCFANAETVSTRTARY